MNSDLDYLTLEALRTEHTTEQMYAVMARFKDPRTVRLLHAAMGMVTESAEFLDMLKRHIFYGVPVDRTNAIEEIGDATWYQRIGCDALEISFLEMMQRNAAKLRSRYPEKFSEERAVNRSLEEELKALEGDDEEHI
jgi:hypothetical protein